MALGNNTQRSYSIIPCFIFIELVIMAGTVLLAYYFECTDTFQVHIQGFFCQDGNLMKPYPGTEDESFISPLVLYCVLASTPTAIIFIGEISMYFIKSTRETLIIQEKTILTGECCYLNPLLRRIIRFIGVFHLRGIVPLGICKSGKRNSIAACVTCVALMESVVVPSGLPNSQPFKVGQTSCLGVFAFGLFATDIFVNAGQVVTGNLSPYFLTVCKPNYTRNDCRAHHQFINNGDICTGDVEVIEKARRSFPSKHAALSIYSALYATMYITSTIKTKSSRLAKPVLCLGTLCAAFLTGLNRVSEYRNHCSDVIAGFILGSAVALFLGICVVHNFKGTHGTPSKPKPEEPRGMPLMAFPRVESPLETLSAQNHSASMTEVT
ncbi:phospholipid phosphatase-related protein type 1 isoform X1 [Apteryx rowi]|uniref:phospholipid phosphatase-related protein type 1 isoform X1 n=1 Tax=Apteryx rowi TaxID=308060 RepID=UPI000E1DA08F|nr:phospholipid phosphatase-related protein type 1 isoform X1 [Apteryx rowi]XP_025934517.1 phospholipid phosphatase-related protein type 1 isoform X1 [Apteryx rowi]XP_025934518.1 phospholipid phosphatase-related protein type 1 isoform X1 [Apteryx rowi]